MTDNTEKTLNDVWMLLGQMDAKLDRVVEDAKSQDGRITTLEKKQWFQAGAVAAVSAFVTALGSYWTR